MLVKVTETLFLRSWWVLLFLLMCLLVYEQESKAVYREYQRLRTLHHHLENTKTQSMTHRKELHLRIQSQSDPKWTELTLKRGLGLVPDNQKKIYFSPINGKR